jgi:hypothetical protein
MALVAAAGSAPAAGSMGHSFRAGQAGGISWCSCHVWDRSSRGRRVGAGSGLESGAPSLWSAASAQGQHSCNSNRGPGGDCLRLGRTSGFGTSPAARPWPLRLPSAATRAVATPLASQDMAAPPGAARSRASAPNVTLRVASGQCSLPGAGCAQRPHTCVHCCSASFSVGPIERYIHCRAVNTRY